MANISRGLDLLLSGLAVAVWGVATFALTSRLVSHEAGGLLGLAVALSGLAFVLATHLGDARLEKLIAGACPRCGLAVEAEHQHRRWEPLLSRWLEASTAWDCANCGYTHAELWDCPGCSQRVD